MPVEIGEVTVALKDDRRGGDAAEEVEKIDLSQFVLCAARGNHLATGVASTWCLSLSDRLPWDPSEAPSGVSC